MKRAGIPLFLAASLALGLVLVAVVPPMGGFDEVWHWFRAVGLLQGSALPQRFAPNDWGGPIDGPARDFAFWCADRILRGVPIGVADARAAAAHLAAQPSAALPLSYPSTASFSPLPYLPLAAGAGIARWFGADILVQYQAGRVANLVAYLGLVAAIVAIVPVARLAWLVLLTAPAGLHLATSFSGDPIDLALPCLLTAWCLRRNLRAHAPLRRWQLAALFAGIASIGLLKLTLLPACLVVLLVPGRDFASASRRAWFAGLAILAAIAVCAAWNRAYPFVPGAYFHTGADPGLALRDVLTSPAQIVAVLWSTATQMPRLAHELVGRFGGHAEPYKIWAPTGLAWLELAVVTALASLGGAGAERRQAAWLAALAAGLAALTLAAFLIGYSPPGSSFIYGLQGRYLLYPACLALLAVSLAASLRARPVATGWLTAAALATHAAIVAIAAIAYYPLWH